MRLSTDPERDEDAAVRTIHAALDAGATLLDTADVYGADAGDLHHSERLIARALASWPGDRAAITVATKGGLVRDGERWGADGRAAHLRTALEASREALGVAAVDLYLLHAVDPRTALETSVRALASLRDAGLARAIGLSNVTLTELERARAITAIDAVEIALSPFDDAAIRGGLVARCIRHGIRVIAHSPLGGPRRRAKLARDPALLEVAARHRATPAQIAIAWLCDLDPSIVPIPGARTPDAAREVIAASRIALDDADRALLDERFPAGAALRSGRDDRRPRPGATGDVVIVIGIQGAGKSTLARELAEDGYARLNRDELGGRLRSLVPRLERSLAGGDRRVVLDNTYPTRAARNEVIEAAWRHGVPVRCVHLETPIEIAQANVARRIVEAHGRLLEPPELDTLSKKDPSVVPPRALFRFRRELELPSLDEGFERIDTIPFGRRPRPGFDRVARLIALDAIAADESLLGALDPGRDFVIAWLPSAPETVLDRARAHGLTIATCAHPAGPPICWCRPPLPGLAVLLIEQHRIDVARSTIVGVHAAHRALAAAVGMLYAAVR
jgi:aryl-alcohol dehydrogenase-like predicted oxidoreductase/predicted kinase